MPVLNLPQKGTLTASGGTANDAIKTDNKILYQVIVTAATSTTTFDFKIEDSVGVDLFLMEDNTGTLNEQVVIPIYSNLTVTVLNASVDEAFTWLLSTNQSL